MVPRFLEQSYIAYQKAVEKTALRAQRSRVAGPLTLRAELFETFLAAPWDILPNFQGPPGRRLRLGRGMDHPRYGRFIYSFAKAYKPKLVVEVGSYAGGTAVGWATGLEENGSGRLVCVDADFYTKGTYPDVTRANIERTGLGRDRFELRSGRATELIPQLAVELRGQVDAYLVDADHTYEGALADLENGLPMMRPGGHILVHDVDPNFRLLETTPEHRQPVWDAMVDFVKRHGFPWARVEYVRRHVGIIQVP
jgi:predicted O-methyltransferase YrrM